MIRVLHLMRSLNAGGIGTFIMNVYRKVDRSKIQFDFAITNSGMGQYGEEIEKLGGRIFFISQNGNRNILDGIKQVTEFYRLCKKNKYTVVHCHYYFANAAFLAAAKYAGVEKRVSHCHNTRTEKVSAVKEIIESIARKFLFHYGTDFLGCSKNAAEFLYGKNAVACGKAKVLYNGIDYEVWDSSRYDKEKLKKKYSVKNSQYVLLFVGRFEKQKNPLFSLEVFRHVREKCENVKYIMVGYGALEEDIKKYIKNYGLSDCIELKPADSDIQELQVIADGMIAPSLWEGLGIAYIEAQKMHTHVFASDNVPIEVNMGYCSFNSLASSEMWAKEIVHYFISEHRDSYIPVQYEIFNVMNTMKQLLKVYEKEGAI